MYQFNITKSVQESVLEGIKPAKVVAEEIGKPYPTLLREMNPYDRGAKLGVETVVDIVKSTGDIEPLRLMIRELGFDMVPMKEAVGAN